MILSMTGFATSTAEVSLSAGKEKIVLSMSIKSLNSRFFELTCKSPSLLNNLEIPIQRLLQKKLRRGHVFISIKILNSELLNQSVTPSLHTIQNYLNAINSIQKEFKFKEEVTLAQVLQLPNTLQSQEVQLNENSETEIIQAVDHLASLLIKTQETEGLSLSHDIRNQLTSMTTKISQIQNLSQELIKSKKAILTGIISQLLEFEPSEEPKSTEQSLLEVKKSNLMYEIEKIDINEETVRFNSHLVNVNNQLESQDHLKGKKIDFIIQELNREINTIAAKCSNIAISSLAIDIKSELEQVREQVQNII